MLVWSCRVPQRLWTLEELGTPTREKYCCMILIPFYLCIVFHQNFFLSYRKFELALLRIIAVDMLHQQGGKSRASSSSKGMEDEEALQTRTLVCKFPDSVCYCINNFTSDRIMPTGIIVCCVFFARNQLVGVV